MLYRNTRPAMPQNAASPSIDPPCRPSQGREPRFLEQAANACRVRHLVYRTEQSYAVNAGWGAGNRGRTIYGELGRKKWGCRAATRHGKHANLHPRVALRSTRSYSMATATRSNDRAAHATQQPTPNNRGRSADTRERLGRQSRVAGLTGGRNRESPKLRKHEMEGGDMR